MPTYHPCIDPNNSWVQDRRDAFEAMHFPGQQRLDEFLHKAGVAYGVSHSRPFIRGAVAHGLALGYTQKELGNLLSIDRSAMSVAKNKGDLGGRPLANLFAIPGLVGKLAGSLSRICPRMGQAGFIAALEAGRTFIGRAVPKELLIDELHYELLCALLHLRRGDDPGAPLEFTEATAVVGLMLRDSGGTPIPEWYGESQRHAASALLQQLERPAFAAEHIRRLRGQWLDLTIYLALALEGPASCKFTLENLNHPTCPATRQQSRSRGALIH